MAYSFSITNGNDGFLPDAIEYHSCEGDDAFDVIRNAIDRFTENSPEGTTVDVASDWAKFVNRGLNNPDASMWSFNLAYCSNGEVLSLNGMTDEEYETQNAIE